MKYLLPLILVCVLLCGCGPAPILTTTVSLGAAEIPPDDALPGDVFGTPIPSGDGQKLFYCTATELRVWDQPLGIHRRIREFGSPQQLRDVLLDGAVLQCEAGDRTFFYSASDGQLLKTFPGTIRVETDQVGYSAVIPLGDLTLRVFGEYNAQPQMMLGGSEPEPYYTADAPDAEGLAKCQLLARQLEEKYGFRILLWEEALKEDGLTGEHLVPVIRRELAVLEQRLSVFPEGMLPETAGHFPQLCLCLVRQRSDSLPCGQFWNGDMLCIALEAGSSGQELYHGLFHAMETHVLSNSKALDRWDGLNPAGFVYDEDYGANAVRDSGIYLLGEHLAFPNHFSMSFPREDRAEVFAHAMMPGNGDLFRAELMQKKLAALCTGIREAFGLEDYEGVLLWEQYLDDP